MKNLLTVSKYSFIEVYRSKVMVMILFMAGALMLIASIASEFAYGAPAKVALDFGLGMMTISNLGMAIFIGATLISKEVEQRTLYMILSKPISREIFLMGKILGLSLVLMINSLLMGALTLIVFKYEGGVIQNLMFWTILFTFLESFLVLVLSVGFSLITNTAMAVIFSVVSLIIGHSLNETARNLFAKSNPYFNSVVKISNVLLPNFYKLSLKDFVLYQQQVSSSYLASVSLYFILYTAAVLALVVYIFKNKNLD